MELPRRSSTTTAPPEPSEPPEASEDETGARSGTLRSLVEWGAVLVGAVVVALVVKMFLFQAFFIPSASMAPTLQEDDRVMVNKLSYDLHDVNRGDIIVFKRPPNEPDNDVDDLIKRVIGLPGETIEARDGRIYIDGQALAEPYLPEGTRTEVFAPETVPEGHLFMMGDNRDDSRDSRFFGPISDDLVVGRAFVRIWPLDDLTRL
ncbi:signal peptidase I [soil metagenome]